MKKSKTWHIGLWIAQVLIGGMFLAVGLMKALTPLDELAKNVPLAGEMPGLVRFIGLSELTGGIGLLLPAALRIRPRLTTLAAVALGVVMMLAVLYHLSRGEYSATVPGLVLGILSATIAWGRTYKAPIEGRPEKRYHAAAARK